MNDRRSFPRLHAELNLAVYSIGRSSLCRLTDISESGLSFSSPSTWQVGDQLAIAWTTDAAQSPFHVAARVCHIGSHNVGVEFKNLSPVDRLRITNFLRSRLVAS